MLAVLAGTVGLGPVGWAAGLVYGAGVVVLLSRALRRSGRTVLGPADLVTLLRSALVGGVAALVADSFSGPCRRPPWWSSPAWPSCSTGWTAGSPGAPAPSPRSARASTWRSTRCSSSCSSVSAARSLGVWVLAIGSVRYVRLVAGRLWPWLRRPVPPRYWCKVVAVVQGVVLTAVAAGVLPRAVAVLALVVVAGLLAESFGREVSGLRRTRRVAPAVEAEAAVVGSRHG